MGESFGYPGGANIRGNNCKTAKAPKRNLFGVFEKQQAV